MNVARIVTRNATTAFAAIVLIVSMIGFISNNNQPVYADVSLPRHAGLNQSLAPALPSFSGATIVLDDSFDRPDSLAVGEGWVEIEPAGAIVSIASNQLFFADTSDVTNRPLVRKGFTPVATGNLQWDFDFDWAKTGDEGTYRFLMQLGDGAVMSDTSQNGGAGVNLIWSNINGAHQSLGYSKGGIVTALAVLSGPAAVSVVADLDTRTYSVAVDGGVVGTGLPFDANVSLNTVRFFTDNLNELNFSGRTIDNLRVWSSDAIPPVNTPPLAQDQTVGTSEDTPRSVTLTATDPVDCQLVITIVAGPSRGTLGAPTDHPCVAGSPNSDTVALVYTPTVGTTGSDSFTWQANDGLDSSSIATVSINIAPQAAVLLRDTFDRPDSLEVGEGWAEVQQTGATVSIASNRLLFDDTSDGASRPLVRRSFAPVATGTLQWDFDFNWAKTGNEDTYRFLMQLGDGAVMSDTSQNGGAGVNLVWSNIDGAHQSLGYRIGDLNNALANLSGPANISVVADLDTQTYSVAIDGAIVQGSIPFDANVASLDTVRLFTDNLNELNFSGRTIDSLAIFASAGNTQLLAAAGPDQEVPVGATVNLDGSGSSDGDGDPLTFRWNLITIPVGSTASLTGSTTFSPSFVADQAGFYVVELVVNDGTADSAPDTVIVDGVNIVTLNLQPVNGQTNVAVNPTLEIDCSVAATTSAQYQIATSSAFTTVVYDSGENINDICSHLALAALNTLTTYFWQGRIKNSQGVWTPWSQPTSFTTVNSTPIFNNVFQDGFNGYSGAGDADIRGSALDPTQVIRERNQGAQDVLRTGRRLPNQPTDEIFRSLLKFDLGAGLTNPNAVVNAYIELTGWRHTDSNHLFNAYNSMYRLNKPWGEGVNVKEINETPGDVSWTYSARPDEWTIPGAASASDTDPDADRSATSLVQMVSTNLEGYKSYWSSKNLVDAVKGWIDDPSSNYGVLIKADDETSQQTLHLASRENADINFRPKLVIVSTESLQAPPNVAPVAEDQSVSTEMSVPHGVLLSFTDSDGPSPYTFAIVAAPSHGALTGTGADRTYTPDLDFAGSDLFTWRVHDGQANSNEAAVTITVSQTDTLLSDTFDRQDSAVVGQDWVELQSIGSATVSIAGNRLFFDDTSDVLRRPLVRRSFSPAATGTLHWDFDFDWARTGADPAYEFWMQLGDSTLMVDPSSDLTRFTGVGVDLRWGSFSNIDQRLIARQNTAMGGPTALTTISGPTHISVAVDLSTMTYSVAIDGTEVGSGLNFDDLSTVKLDTVRFFTSNLDEVNFSGRTIDNLRVSTAASGNNPPVAVAGPDQGVPVGATVDLDASGSTDADGDVLTYSWTLTAVPADSTASLIGATTANPSFVADLAGTYSAELVTNDGTVDSAPDTVSVTAAPGDTSTLLLETFDRPDNPVVGEGWVELQSTGSATVSIASNRLFFDNTSDVLRRPLVRRSFAPVATGTLQWDFDFDWARISPDPNYELWMQLGDSALMVDPSSDPTRFTGVGVDLRWGSFGNIDQNLVARQNTAMGGPTALTTISGPTHVAVTVDLVTRTYYVAINGGEVGSGLNFDDLDTAKLDTVRFFTSNLNETSFLGRTFDNVMISVE